MNVAFYGTWRHFSKRLNLCGHQGAAGFNFVMPEHRTVVTTTAVV